MNSYNKEWQMPEELKKVKLPGYPIHSFPYNLKDYIEAVAEELQIPIDMVATSVLAAFALCNQGKYVVQGKVGWNEPVNLYAINIARPSERKSPTMAKVIKPIVEYEQEENERRRIDVMNSKERMEAYHNKLKYLKNKYGKDAKKDKEIEIEIEKVNEIIANYEVINYIRLTVDDITPEALVSVMAQNNEKMGIFSDEGGIFATLAGRYSNSIPNIEVILKAFNGTKVDVDRKGRETERLHNPYLTILLFVQPIVLNEVFANKEFRGRGLCARFLYCYPNSIVGTRNINSNPMPYEIEEKYNNIIKAMLQKKSNKVNILQLSPEAYNISQNFGAELEIKLKTELEEIEEWAGKFHGTVLRIAGNIHLVENVDNDNLIISEETMIKAIEIGLYYLENAKYVYNIMGEDEENVKAKRIIKILKGKKLKGDIKKYELFRAVRGTGIQEIKDIENPLNILIEKGYMRMKEEEKQEKIVGRPADKIIELNPLVFK